MTVCIKEYMLPFIIEKDYIDQTDDGDEDEWLDRQTDIQIETQEEREEGWQNENVSISSMGAYKDIITFSYFYLCIQSNFIIFNKAINFLPSFSSVFGFQWVIKKLLWL